MHLDDWQASCSQFAATSEPSLHTASSMHHIIEETIQMRQAALMTPVGTMARL